MSETTKGPLTDTLCWTRVQAEAGEPLVVIVERKEKERQASGGVFLWGVGTAPSKAVIGLVAARQKVDVVFSVMKSRPQPKDASPSGLLRWTGYWSDGRRHSLPEGALVTSRDAPGKSVHYALLCHSESPLVLGDYGAFDPTAYRNLTGERKGVGASQVTALVERKFDPREPADYRVNMRATLTGGYWVRLLDPVKLSGSQLPTP